MKRSGCLKRNKGFRRRSPGQDEPAKQKPGRHDNSSRSNRKGKKKGRKKRRKKAPSASRLKKECDSVWSRIIRSPGRCAVCGRRTSLQAHHLIRRNVIFYRHDLANGICLCPSCHEYSNKLSAHGAPWAFEDWMREHLPDQYQWWCEHRHVLHVGEKVDYAEVLADLKKIYEEDKAYRWTCSRFGMKGNSDDG